MNLEEYLRYLKKEENEDEENEEDNDEENEEETYDESIQNILELKKIQEEDKDIEYNTVF